MKRLGTVLLLIVSLAVCRPTRVKVLSAAKFRFIQRLGTGNSKVNKIQRQAKVTRESDPLDG